MQIRTALLATLALAFASASAEAGPKKYFLTPDVYPTTEAQDACGKGFHMASLFEILDPTQLTYDTKRGQVMDDSGSGPPSGVPGWIRTGGASSESTTAGTGNCSVLSSTAPFAMGSAVQLDADWSEAGLGIGPWTALSPSCAASRRVWCKQN